MLPQGLKCFAQENKDGVMLWISGYVLSEKTVVSAVRKKASFHKECRKEEVTIQVFSYLRASSSRFSSQC